MGALLQFYLLMSGKSTLTNSLVASAGIGIKEEAVVVPITDTRADQAEPGISIRSTNFSLLYAMDDESVEAYNGKGDGNKYLINIIDSPGHVDFASEATAAIHITDGALVVIDCIEGICMQTETVLHQALSEMVRPILCLSKMDKLFPGHEVEGAKPEFTGEQVYQILSNIIQNANAILAANDAERLGDVQIYPENGTVAFSSCLHGWAFRLADFAEMYALKYKKADANEYMKFLWGDNFFDSATGKWTTKDNGSGTCIRGFVKFIYNPIKSIMDACMNDDKGELWKMCSRAGVSIKDDDKDLTGRALVKCVMQTWMPASTTLLKMMIFHLPSPLEAQKYRVENLYEGPLDDMYAEAIRNCDPDGPLMLYVSKMIPASDMGKFFAFGRVFSGRVAAGMKVRIMGRSYVPSIKNDLYPKSVEHTIIWTGNNQYDVEDIPCGSTVGLTGLDGYIIKSATLTNEKELDACPIRAMKFSVSPVMFVTVECKVSSDIPKLVEGLKRLANSDLVVLCSEEESGKYRVAAVGELHLEICLKDLQECLMDGAEVTVSSPVVSYRETVLGKTCNVEGKSLSTNNSLSIVARPLHKILVEAIDAGQLGPHTDRVVRSQILAKCGWDEDLADKIWSFGPDAVGPNMVVDMCKRVQNLELAKKFVVAGFELASKEGALAKEKMRGICFEIHNVAIHVNDDSRAKTAMVQTAIYESQLAAKPRLLEPVYIVAMEGPQSALHAIYGILEKKGGEVYQVFEREYTQQFHARAYISVNESFGLAKEIRAATAGQVYPQCVFGYWDSMASDPFQASSTAGQRVLDIRERKMLRRPSFQN
jgi:elongation factor 2